MNALATRLSTWLRLLVIGAGIAWAPQVPAQTAATRIVVGYAPGGGADGVARAYARAMSASLGREVIVENRPGAGGTLSAVAVKHAPADGSTLLLGAIVLNVLAPLTLGKVGFEPADFTPVGQMSRMDSGLAVSADSPYKRVGDLLAAAKADPLKATFGSPAAGSLAHFFGLMLGEAGGVPLQHVPYKGSGPLVVDIASGQVPAGISSAGDFVQMHKDGRVRLLATSGEKRSPFTPDVPTFREVGYPTVTGSSWTGLFVPAATPPDVVRRLSRAVEEASRDPEVRKALTALNMEPPNVDAAGFARLLVEERKRWEPVVKASGFTADK